MKWGILLPLHALSRKKYVKQVDLQIDKLKQTGKTVLWWTAVKALPSAVLVRRARTWVLSLKSSSGQDLLVHRAFLSQADNQWKSTKNIGKNLYCLSTFIIIVKDFHTTGHNKSVTGGGWGRKKKGKTPIYKLWLVLLVSMIYHHSNVYLSHHSSQIIFQNFNGTLILLCFHQRSKEGILVPGGAVYSTWFVLPHLTLKPWGESEGGWQEPGSKQIPLPQCANRLNMTTCSVLFPPDVVMMIPYSLIFLLHPRCTPAPVICSCHFFMRLRLRLDSLSCIQSYTQNLSSTFNPSRLAPVDTHMHRVTHS